MGWVYCWCTAGSCFVTVVSACSIETSTIRSHPLLFSHSWIIIIIRNALACKVQRGPFHEKGQRNQQTLIHLMIQLIAVQQIAIAQCMVLVLLYAYVTALKWRILICHRLKRTVILQQIKWRICQTITNATWYIGGTQQMYILSVERRNVRSYLNAWFIGSGNTTRLMSIVDTNMLVICTIISLILLLVEAKRTNVK